MRTSLRVLLLSLFMLLLAGCGGGGGSSSGGGSGDWFFVWNCNGDSECLMTNAAGTPSGSLDEGPDESACTPLVTFAQQFWGSAATYACTQNPNGGGSSAAPTLTGFSPSSTAPGNTITIAGTNFASGDTVTINNLNCAITTISSTQIVCTVPAMGNFIGNISITTSGGTITSSSSLTVVNHFYGATSSNNQSVAVGGNGTVDGSVDGVTWRGIKPTADALYAIAWSGTRFTTVGQAGTIVTTSTDGLSWLPQTSGTSSDLFGVAWSSPLSLMAAVGRNGTIVTSPDGVTWTARTSPISTTLASVAWCGSQFVVTGNAGVILTSPDGTTWTSQTSGTSKFLNGIACLGSLIAVGEGNDTATGEILTSPDGITWTQRALSTTDAIYGMASSTTQFVAVGLGGTVYTSPNGTSWTLRTTPTTQSLNAVTWFAAGSQFVAVGGFGTILTSADGVSWTARTSR